MGSSSLSNPNVGPAADALGGTLVKAMQITFLLSTLLGDPSLGFIDLTQNNFMAAVVNASQFSSPAGQLISADEYHGIFSNTSAFDSSEVISLQRLVTRLNRTSHYYSMGVNTLSDAEDMLGRTASRPILSSDPAEALAFQVAEPNSDFDFIYLDQYSRVLYSVVSGYNDTLQRGYTGLDDELSSTTSAYQAAITQEQQGVCAAVRVELSKQVLSAVREDFEAPAHRPQPAVAAPVQLQRVAGHHPGRG